ncbi:MAG: extracellular solute-binding protein [Beijerinckiaceae bacterium]|jgi:peptide/nickel transport system substrate-binding protein|nr:extracellular solute-binding protein [Beijerinckiaceae bacterium]
MIDRAIRRACLGLLLLPAVLGTPLAGSPARAQAPGAELARHGIAMHGEPALPPDFAHLPYADPKAVRGGRLSIGFQGTFDSLNPFNLKAGSTAQGLNTNVFQTLMTRSLDEPFTLYGLIAKTIETDDARENVIFRLDPNARFSDGTPIRAEDVRFTFELLKAKGRPQQRSAYALVKSIETPDELTIRYDLTGSGDREMPLTLALMPVLSKKHTNAETFAETSLETPIGSGPYVISAVRPGESLILKRNPDYWGKDLPAHRGMFNFDEIRIEYFRDAASLYEAFKGGLVDYREETNPTRWLTGYDFPAMTSGRMVKASAPIGVPKGMVGFAFNTRRPLFADARLREALGLMFDFEWINAKLFGGLYSRTKSFFDESDLASTGRPASARERDLLAPFPGAVRDDILEGRWRPPSTDGSGRDRDSARKALNLLKAAGYALSNGALVERKTGEPVAFEIMVTDRNQERLALNYASSLSRIGVRAQVRLVDEVQYQRRRQGFDFDMMLGTWLASASPGNEQRSRWGSASARQEASFNLAGVASPAVDAMIAAMLAATSREDFVAAVRAFDRLLLSGFYIVPLFHASEQWFAHSTKLTRPERNAGFAAPLFGATLDTWWRKEP